MVRLAATVVLVSALFASSSAADAQGFSPTVCVLVFEPAPAPPFPFMQLHLVAQSYPFSSFSTTIAYAIIGTAITAPGELRPVYGSAYDIGTVHFALTVGPESPTPGATPAMLLRGVLDITNPALTTPGVCQQRVGDSPCGVEKSVRFQTFMNDRCEGPGIVE